MGSIKHNNPSQIPDDDLAQAARELDKKFPGAADHDGALEKHKAGIALRKKIVKNIVFHGIFYSLFVTGFTFLFRNHNAGILGYMIYALSWFLFYFCSKK